MYCMMCGAEVAEDAKFCKKCGNVIQKNTNVVPQIEMPHLVPVKKYTGEEKVFPFLGAELHIPEEVDSFIRYRQVFKANAMLMADVTRQQYCQQIHGLDEFFNLFTEIYCGNIKPLLADALLVAMEYGLYDVTGDDLINQYMSEFCSVEKTHRSLLEAADNKLIERENAIHEMYSNIPNIWFMGGIGTVLAVEAANQAIKYSYKKSLNNLNLTFQQKQELYYSIDFEKLMNDVYLDYWNVVYTLCQCLRSHGFSIWYPTAEGNARAEALMRNLRAGLIPDSERVNVMLEVFKCNPIQGSLFGYLRRNYSWDDDIENICCYFGF